jgi:hypothetical protein
MTNRNRQNRFNEELQRLIITALNEDETANNNSNILHNIEFMFTQPTRSSPYSSSYYYIPDTSNNNTDTSNNNTDTSNNNTNIRNNSNNINRNIRQINNRRNNNNNNNNLETLINSYSRNFSVYQSQVTEYQNTIRSYIENYYRNEYTINQSRTSNRINTENLQQRETINIPSSISRPIRTENINNYDDNTIISGLFTMYPDSIIDLLHSVNGLLFADSSNNTHETSINQPLSQESVENLINLNSTVFKFNCENYPNNDVCPISLDPFVEDEEVVKFNICGHMFKKPLIVNWLIRHNNCCPVCRRTITTSISSTETNNETAEESEVEIDIIFN